jgi:hypothetical protein
MGYTISMNCSAGIECELLRLVVSATDREGYPIFFTGDLWQRLRVVLQDIDAQEIVDACRRLWPKFLSRCPWNRVNLRFCEYEGENEANAFFYGAAFRLRRAPFSRSALEQLSGPSDEPETKTLACHE